MTSLITDSADGTAPRRGPLERGFPLPRSAPPTVSSTLHRLSSMASLRAWEQRSTPALMHQAILDGVNARHAAEAAHLSVEEAHVRWGDWAAKQLAPQRPGVAAELPVQQFLNVHAAFAAALAGEDAR
ncbi:MULTISPECIES: hypothetical protein [Amycolatopsis]|uniref:hypothetical protein n=1 Tax=Amycolatopsis TaxID=1813 RepID=UPI0005603CAB|nr:MULTISPECIES: hypothetical protein [Amycolatopsis]MCG3754421.1 hypothetical protein [Amycolatopsis sp. Poz14]